MTKNRRNGSSSPSEGEDRNPDLVDHVLIAAVMTAANAYALSREGLRLIRKELSYVSGGIRAKLGAKPMPEAEPLDS
ncbi:MAG: hypothetical protein UT33_C0012G0056 [Candidatus Peregrinibacteria bacterium GW2011_GWC2_39_14]|nr:MAG: hypothetical protein US92_C0003G0083 [Candidatus Peregrinibacteria bacterium GW2011_GWA2_38_36]KKR05251.1 MAG: hypothetical protein UT33_C0012G0056 [Candidatus Peregrinibacteria bacterium GW2011_GWC2_39_14]